MRDAIVENLGKVMNAGTGVSSVFVDAWQNARCEEVQSVIREERAASTARAKANLIAYYQRKRKAA